MSQKSYRRLTRFLFLLLFLLFLLLYLLLQGKSGGRPGGHGGPNWIERTLPLGDVRVSDVRSGGFIVDDFPLPASTSLDSGDFNENVIAVSTSIYNEGETAVTVTPSIYGTRKAENANANPGLHCAFYTYSGDTDPAGGDFAAFLSNSDWSVTPHQEKALELHVRGEAAFTLEPGETRRVILFFWADAAKVPTLTDQERGEYSVTVKLTSRERVVTSK